MDIEKCKAEIKRHEGEVLEIYEDSLGYKTLGIGHLCQPNDPEYNWEVGTKVSQEVVDMYYNLGSSRFSKFKNMLDACRKHDWERMAAEMEDSRWFKQVGRRSVELQESVLNTGK